MEPVGKRINENTKHLLKTILNTGQDISFYKNSLSSGIGNEEAFNRYYSEILELIRLFYDCKSCPTKNNYSLLLKQVERFGYSPMWIDGILKTNGVTVPLSGEEDAEVTKNQKQEEQEKLEAERLKREQDLEKRTREEEIKRKEQERQALEEAKRKAQKEEAERKERERLTRIEAERLKREQEEAERREAERQAREEAKKQKKDVKPSGNKFCRKCGNMIQDNTPFCSKCGAAQQVKKCKICRKDISEDAVFCPYCNSFCVSKK